MDRYPIVLQVICCCWVLWGCSKATAPIQAGSPDVDAADLTLSPGDGAQPSDWYSDEALPDANELDSDETIGVDQVDGAETNPDKDVLILADSSSDIAADAPVEPTSTSADCDITPGLPKLGTTCPTIGAMHCADDEAFTQMWSYKGPYPNNLCVRRHVFRCDPALGQPAAAGVWTKHAIGEVQEFAADAASWVPSCAVNPPYVWTCQEVNGKAVLGLRTAGLEQSGGPVEPGTCEPSQLGTQTCSGEYLATCYPPATLPDSKFNEIKKGCEKTIDGMYRWWWTKKCPMMFCTANGVPWQGPFPGSCVAESDGSVRCAKTCAEIGLED